MATKRTPEYQAELMEASFGRERAFKMAQDAYIKTTKRTEQDFWRIVKMKLAPPVLEEYPTLEETALKAEQWAASIGAVYRIESGMLILPLRQRIFGHVKRGAVV